jgi:hypothetical protein
MDAEVRAKLLEIVVDLRSQRCDTYAARAALINSLAEMLRE